MDTTTLFYRFGVALAIGLLVGLQREYAKGGSGREIFAGERTLALMGLVGCTAAMVADVLDSAWAFTGIFLAQSGLIVIAHFVDARRGKVGLTSEVAALLTTLAGALCYWDYLPLAVALAVATTAASRLIGCWRGLLGRCRWPCGVTCDECGTCSGQRRPVRLLGHALVPVLVEALDARHSSSPVSSSTPRYPDTVRGDTGGCC